MKVAELMGGSTATLRVRWADSTPDPLPLVEDEVELTHTAGRTLLAWNGSVHTVVGMTPRDAQELQSVVLSGLPCITYVAQVSSHGVVIESRTFPQEMVLGEGLELGLDDKVMDDIRRVHHVGGTVADVAAWLMDRLCLQPAPSAPNGPLQHSRLVVSGDVRGRLDAFRVRGHRIAADIKRVDNKLRIDKVVRGARNDNSRLLLLHAPTTILDATIAAEQRSTVRAQLSQAVGESQSYLRTWQEYHKVEQENVLRRARLLGAVEYHKCERRKDGGWSFHVASGDDLQARLAQLGEANRFEIEAGSEPPSFEALDDGPSGGRTRQGRGPRLSSTVLRLDANRRILDLAPPDEGEDQARPPECGFLYVSMRGDATRLRRRERAEEALRTGNCGIPQLGLLMEGRPAGKSGRRTRINVESPKLRKLIQEAFGSSRPTQRQLEAIEYALNTPDVCLIQGPPGTGKTQVITAIARCLAALADEGTELSHRILVTAAQHDARDHLAGRTSVFGLPPGTVGHRRRGSDTAIDTVQQFARDRIELLRSKLRTTTEGERLARARTLAVACLRSRSLPAEEAARLRELASLLDGVAPSQLIDRVRERASWLERPTGMGDPEHAKRMEQSARAIRVDVLGFGDDGPYQAQKALVRLGSVLTPEERSFLEKCQNLEPGVVPPWLGDGVIHRDAILDRLARVPEPAKSRTDGATMQLLGDLFDAVEQRLAATRSGAEMVVSNYILDLENDPEGLREALRHYTVVLAATLSQSASAEMRRVRGIDEGQATFPSVIVDEAARAHPLDLFIPLSMAARRVVLVGDHRQLPHLLEPDVERELEEGVNKGSVEAQTLEAIRASLFERLWVILRGLEEKDRIRRTVTLNTQYRMHPVLGQFVSSAFYEAHEDGAIESPRAAREFVHDLPGYTKAGIPCVAAWIDVPSDCGREQRGMSKIRPAEARTIAAEVSRLIDHDPRLTFGVIAFYSAQVDAIGQAMLGVGLTEVTSDRRGWQVADCWQRTFNHQGREVERLRIGTVDAFQGMEFDVVFLSITRSNDLRATTDQDLRRKYGHLMLENRLCVAMSRQQRVLVAVGDLQFIQASPLSPLRSYVDLCGGQHGIIR